MYPTATREEARAQREAGRTWSQVSRSLGVSRSTLQEWSRHPQGNGSRGTDCPRCDDAHLDGAGYAALLGFYLGDGCLSAHPRCFALRVACDRRLPRIVDDVHACICAVRPGAKVFDVAASGAVQVTSLWQHWPCLFPQHGPGRKHLRDVSLHDWQRQLAEKHPDALLRGLFHSDGSRVQNWARRQTREGPRTYPYARWQFDNRSEDVLETCTWALDLVGVAWRRSNRHTISVSHREAVAELDRLIGPKA